MKPGLELTIGQNLTITPQLQQAIKLLQLSSVDLNVEIAKLLEENPLLEVDETKVTTEWEDNYSYTYANQKSQSEGFDFDNVPTNSKSLQEYLSWQLELSSVTPRDLVIGEMIIDAINDDGYLIMSIEDLYLGLNKNSNQTYHIEMTQLLSMLKLIQHLDPIGVASRDLKECLSIQLDLLAPSNFLAKCKFIVNHHLDLLGQKKYSQLKKILKLDNKSLKEILQILLSLNPRPGSVISAKNTDYIIPDVLVVKSNAGWTVKLNPEIVTNIKINNKYAGLVTKNTKDAAYLKENLAEAKFFIKSLQNRNDTLLRVATSIVQLQTEFLDMGSEKMRPLVLQDIATLLDLHESTISRITNNKYIHTPQGVFELKYFFSSHVGTDTGGDCSSTAIKAIIKKLVDEEREHSPLSDQRIVEVLLSRGVKIARRTVAKYRESLKIPPSSQRKSLIEEE